MIGQYVHSQTMGIAMKPVLSLAEQLDLTAVAWTSTDVSSSWSLIANRYFLKS